VIFGSAVLPAAASIDPTAIRTTLAALSLPPALADAIERTVLYNQLLWTLWRLAPTALATVDAEAAAAVLLPREAAGHPHAPDALECSSLLCALAVAWRLPYAAWMDSLHGDVLAVVARARTADTVVHPLQQTVGEGGLGTTLAARTVLPTTTEGEDAPVAPSSPTERTDE
jgi:hypothetical protein